MAPAQRVDGRYHLNPCNASQEPDSEPYLNLPAVVTQNSGHPYLGELQSPTRRGQAHVFGQRFLMNFIRFRRKMHQTPDFAVLLQPHQRPKGIGETSFVQKKFLARPVFQEAALAWACGVAIVPPRPAFSRFPRLHIPLTEGFRSLLLVRWEARDSIIGLLFVRTCCNVAVIWYKLRMIDGGHRGHPSGNEVKPTDTRCVEERALGTRQRHSRSSCRNVEEIVCGRIELGYDR